MAKSESSLAQIEALAAAGGVDSHPSIRPLLERYQNDRATLDALERLWEEGDEPTQALQDPDEFLKASQRRKALPLEIRAAIRRVEGALADLAVARKAVAAETESVLDTLRVQQAEELARRLQHAAEANDALARLDRLRQRFSGAGYYGTKSVLHWPDLTPRGGRLEGWLKQLAHLRQRLAQRVA